jgi:hypothetical protein
VLRKYERILEATGLNPDRIFAIADEEPEAVVPVLQSMIDQVVRSEIILEYTMIDADLDHLLFKHFFGSGKKLEKARRTKRYRTLRLPLEGLYILQKLSLVRSFTDVPRSVASKIAAINDLRNGIAHAFHLSDLKKSKRTYKGMNVFTPKGLEVFRRDAAEIRHFFYPWLETMLDNRPSSYS